MGKSSPFSRASVTNAVFPISLWGKPNEIVETPRGSVVTSFTVPTGIRDGNLFPNPLVITLLPISIL